MGRRGILPAALALAVAVGVVTSSLSFVAAPPPQPVAEGVSRRDALQATVAATALGSLSAAPAAWAGPLLWSGSYLDPQHDGCLRRIIKEGDSFAIIGTSAADGSKDCKPKAAVTRWEVKGTVPFNPFADEMIIDFSPKGGPASVTATLSKSGISFPDGNKWKKLKRGDNFNGLTQERQKGKY
mmetsp:Transcript_43031/g.98944  ORF Transcript_43031/g.98944 Transcript_43031/m.98944 type:complete len:183 (+) Transcript_43031:71-619(+)